MSANQWLVAVDDTDPAIKWDGPWFDVRGSTDDWGMHGPPFLRTLRGITTNGSFSLSFRGTSFSVWGSLRPRTTVVSTEDGNITVHDPDWDCLIDGKGGEEQWEHPSEPRSNFELCSRYDLSDEDHTLEVRATVRSETLWIDQVQYRASLDVDVSTAWTEVDFREGRFEFSRSWGKDGEDGYGTGTTTTGASFRYQFVGEEIILGGYNPGTSNTLDGLGTYSLDFGPPVEFRIPASANMKTNQPYFNITDMEPGPHILEVVNRGNASTAPLAFRYIYTKNTPMRPGPLARPSGTSSAPSQTSQPSTPGGVSQANAESKSKVIGGAIGGVLAAILLAAILIFLFIRIHRRRAKTNRSSTLTPSAFIIDTRMLEHSGRSTDFSGSPTVPTTGGLGPITYYNGSPTQLPSTQPSDSSSPPHPPSHSRPPSYDALSAPSPTFHSDEYPSFTSALTPFSASNANANRTRRWAEK